jgi:hypothetical protein
LKEKSSFLSTVLSNAETAWLDGIEAFLTVLWQKKHIKGRNKHISSIYATTINLVPPRIKNANMSFLTAGKEKYWAEPCHVYDLQRPH